MKTGVSNNNPDLENLDITVPIMYVRQATRYLSFCVKIVLSIIQMIYFIWGKIWSPKINAKYGPVHFDTTHKI